MAVTYPTQTPVLTEAERRLLWVLTSTEGWVRQQDVIRRAHMATGRCTDGLRALRAGGLIDAALAPRGVGGGSGAPSYIYQVTDRGRATLTRRGPQ